MPCILACHPQIDADSDMDPAYYFDADAGLDPSYHFERIRILPFTLMRIRADPDPQHWILTLLLVRLDCHMCWRSMYL
jgi:hypothetical protein